MFARARTGRFARRFSIVAARHRDIACIPAAFTRSASGDGGVAVSSQWQATGGSWPGDADDGYFAPLASARYVLLTTFDPEGGTPTSSAQRVVVDGDRAYFRARNGSAASKRLGLASRVQVAPCTALGLCSFGPPFNATARLLAGEQARAAARKLVSKHPARHGLLTPLSRWVRRWQPLHYELLADEAPEEPRSDTAPKISLAWN